MQFDGIDVSKFKYLMWTLVSRAGDPKMSTLIQHTAKKASVEERLAIVKGINYIAEPCARALDFRIYFYELCQAHEFEGIQHFLDPESIQVFDALIAKTGGRYTVGVYDELTNYAKRKAEEYQQSHPEPVERIAPKLVPLNRHLTPSLRAIDPGQDVSIEDVSSERLSQSIAQRVLEAHYLNTNRSVSYALANAAMNYRPLTEFVTDANRDLWQFLQMDQDFSLANAIVHKPEIKAVLAQTQSVSKYYLAKRLNVNEQLDFALFEFNQLPGICESDPELFACLLLDDVRLLRVDLITDKISELYFNPPLINSDNNIRLQSLNHTLTPELKRLATQCDKLLTITDDSHILSDLDLLIPHANSEFDKHGLPNSLVQYLVRPRQAPDKLQQAFLNSKELRKEDRFSCKTTCILIDRESKQARTGKTINMSSKGLAVRLEQSEGLSMHDDVFVSLPSVNKRMSTSVKNQLYSVVAVDGQVVRLKVAGAANQRSGEQLLVDFLAKYQSQLLASGKTESVPGLTQSLRAVTTACHQSIPFTFSINNRSCYVDAISTNRHSQLSNLKHDKLESDLTRLLMSDAFGDYLRHLYMRLLEGHERVTGYLLLLPRWQDKQGKEHRFWLQDLDTLAKKQTGFEFISKLHKVAKPAVLSIQLSAPKTLNDQYFCDELKHLNRIDPLAADALPTKTEDVVAVGEIKEISELFVPFSRSKEDIVLLTAPEAEA